MKPILTALFCAATLGAQTWTPQPSGTTASLRGVSGVNAQVAWASGSGGTYLLTTDGGATWRAAKVPGAETLDFRAVHAKDGQTAWLLSIGSGEKSRIYQTTDAGSHWNLQFTNSDPKGFLDSLAFWDTQHGIALGDPVDGHFMVLTTDDGGKHWQPQHTPPAVEKEGAFAASNSCLIVMGKQEAWFGTGGPQGARVFHSTDGGRTWSVAATPVRNDGSSAGIFSLAFSDVRHGIAVGGDYSKTEDAQKNIAITSDGGRTWTVPGGSPKGFRSAVEFVPARKMWVVAGTSGSDISTDGGQTWTAIGGAAYNAISFTPAGDGWAVGPKGAVAKFDSAH